MKTFLNTFALFTAMTLVAGVTAALADQQRSDEAAIYSQQAGLPGPGQPLIRPWTAMRMADPRAGHSPDRTQRRESSDARGPEWSRNDVGGHGGR